MQESDTIPDPPPDAEEEHTGQLVGDAYLLEGRLGHGGMGAVYEAVHVRMGYRVAVKLASGVGPQARDRSLREIEAMARLDDPGIVRVIDAGPYGDGYYLALERLHGRDLQELLDSRMQLPIHGACGIAAEIAATCCRMHAKGVTHRDLKPSNVFLCDGGEVKLIDFGLAKLTEDSVGRLTATGATMGTSTFMAPEQVMNAHDVGPPADMYALGGLLLVMLTGRLPHPGPSLVEQYLQAMEGDVPDLRELLPGVSPVLADLVRGLMSKEPEARPVAGEIGATLGALARGGR